MARKSRANNALIISDTKNRMWNAGLYGRHSIKRIIVRPDKSIRIEWNFSDELSGLVEFPEICFEKQAI